LLALRPETELVIAQYRFAPDSDNNVQETDLIRGGLRAVSGALGRATPERVNFNTPVATMGIRGTGLQIVHLDPGQQVPADSVGTYLLVESGQVILDDLGTPSNIVFHGLVGFEKLKYLLSSAGAFVFPTYLEGSARAVSEAMAASLPVITTPQSGAPITNGVTGVLLEADDSASWIEAVMNLRNEPEVAARMGKAARNAIKAISGPSYSSSLFCALSPKARQ
jgi:hypothetical protein